LDDELIAAIERTSVWRESERWALRGADLAGERGQRARARQWLEHWAGKHSDSAPVFSRLGRLASLDRDFPAAIEAFRRLARLERGAAQRSALLALARVCEAAGRPGEAISEVERVLAEGGETAELRRELGKLYAHAGARAKQARLLVEDARQAKAPVRGDLLLKAAELFATESAWDEANAVLDTLAQEDAHRPEAVLVRARWVAGTEGNAAGRAFLERHLSEMPKRERRHARFYRVIAEFHLADDELAEALAALWQAHQLDRTDPEIALALGLVAYDLDQLDLAASSLRSFLATKESATAAPQLSRAYFVLACIEQAKGQRTVARRMASRALEVDAANEHARRLLGTLN
jgi:tetratricopeptide (TPR) repeat protein